MSQGYETSILENAHHFQVHDLWQFLHTSVGFGIDHFVCSLQANTALGHPQQEHETGHGIMSHTQWAIDSPEGNSVELTRNGHIFSQNGDGTPLLCNLACESLGRHVHIDTCHGESHDNPEVQHIKERVGPNPDQAKDWITHELYWRRMGGLTLRFFFLA